MKDQSESDLSEQINDQLSQLWSNAKSKRKQLLSHLTPYSKRNQQSFNSSLIPKPQTSFKGTQKDRSGLEHEVIRLRDKLENQVSQGRHKDIQMDRLKRTAQQLAVQKKYLVRELQQTHILDENNNSKILNESSILPRGKSNSAKRQKLQRSKSKKVKKTIDRTTIDHLQDLSKERLVQLVRSTSQYRSYVFYYDSNELSYLRKLQEQHKKNCNRNPGEKEKCLWAPTDLVQDIKVLSMRQQLNLTEHNIQTMVARLKGMYEANSSSRLSKLRQTLQSKLQKQKRVSQNSVPYDLVQVTRAHQRQISRWSTKRSATVLK